jgi:hypothetical protein
MGVVSIMNRPTASNLAGGLALLLAKAKCRLHRGMSEFEGQSGKHMLVLSSSQYDPEQKF